MALPIGVLNHIELVYRPGERELARSIFELFGCEVWENSIGWLVVEDVVLVSEVTPEQWEFEKELAKFLETEGSGHAANDSYGIALRTAPQRYNHFGFGFRTESQWQESMDRVQEAGGSGPLAGRVEVATVFRPGDPGSFGDHLIQGFVRTDVFSAGVLALGQTVELQHYFSNDSRRPRAKA